jgi:hypothetical protein
MSLRINHDDRPDHRGCALSSHIGNRSDFDEIPNRGGTRPTALCPCPASGGDGSCADVITRSSGGDGGRPDADVPSGVTERFLDIEYGLAGSQ